MAIFELENLVGYTMAGFSLAVADKLSSHWLGGKFREHYAKKEAYSAMKFVVGTFEPEQMDSLKNDAEFAEAFLRTQEYFATKQTSPRAVETSARNSSVKPNARDTRNWTQKIYEGARNAVSREYWSREKINNASFRTKVAAGVVIPVLVDLFDAVRGTTTMSETFWELAETPIEASGLVVGLYVGKPANAGIEWIFSRYDRKLAKIEQKITANTELKKALGETIIAPVKIDKAVYAVAQIEEKVNDLPPATGKAPEKDTVQAQPKRSVVDEATQTNNDLVDRMNKLGSGQ